jgi:hypothetical protein
MTVRRPVARWSPVTGDGSNAGPLVISYPAYDEGVEQLIAALLAVNAQPVADCQAWPGVEGCRAWHRSPDGTTLHPAAMRPLVK